MNEIASVSKLLHMSSDAALACAAHLAILLPERFVTLTDGLAADEGAIELIRHVGQLMSRGMSLQEAISATATGLRGTAVVGKNPFMLQLPRTSQSYSGSEMPVAGRRSCPQVAIRGHR